MWNDIRGSLSKPRRNGNENVTEQKQSNGYTRALCTFRSRPLQTTTWNDQVMPILEYLSHGWVAPPTPTHHSKRTQILGLGTTVATSHNLGTTPDKWAFSPMSRNMNNFSFFSYKPTPIDCGLLSSDPKYLQYFIRQPAHILFIVRGFNVFSFLSFFPFCLWFIYWFRTCLVSSKSDGCKKWWLILSSVGRTNTSGLLWIVKLLSHWQVEFVFLLKIHRRQMFEIKLRKGNVKHEHKACVTRQDWQRNQAHLRQCLLSILNCRYFR